MTTQIHPGEDPMGVAGFVLPDVPKLNRAPLFDCFIVEPKMSFDAGIRRRKTNRSDVEAAAWADGICPGMRPAQQYALWETLKAANAGTYYYANKFIIVCVA